MTLHSMDTPQFLICSSVDRHLDCFNCLAIVNSTAMNLCVHVFIALFLVLWDIFITIELLGYIVILCTTFEETLLFETTKF